MGDLAPSPRTQGTCSFLADAPSPQAAGAATWQPTVAAEIALARQEFLAAASASNPLARALFVRLAAVLASQELRGQVFRRMALGDDSYQR